MTIVDLLKLPGIDIRVSHGDVWLYYDDATALWVVRSHTPYARQTTVVIETADEAEAVAAFVAQCRIEMDALES